MNQDEKSSEQFQRQIDEAYKEALERFPKPGAKLRYRGTTQFWFAELIANAERELRIGEIYTLKTVKLALSWAGITLEETGDTEYSLGFFDDPSEIDRPPNAVIDTEDRAQAQAFRKYGCWD